MTSITTHETLDDVLTLYLEYGWSYALPVLMIVTNIAIACVVAYGMSRERRKRELAIMVVVMSHGNTCMLVMATVGPVLWSIYTRSVILTQDNLHGFALFFGIQLIFLGYPHFVYVIMRYLLGDLRQTRRAIHTKGSVVRIKRDDT